MARVIFLLTEENIFQKSTYQKQELPVVAMFVNQSRKNEQSLQRTFYRCFLPSFGSFAKRFQRRRFLKIGQSEIRIACGGHVCPWIGTKSANFIENLSQMLPTKFQFIWESGFRGEDFLEINQSKTRMACGGHVYFKQIGTK